MEENKVQVLLYTSYLHVIGGIETFIMNFLEVMGTKYEIGVLCPQLDQAMIARIKTKAKMIPVNTIVYCDTLIMVRMNDVIPRNIIYEKSIRMCHACKSDLFPSWKVREDCDSIVHVSKASLASFGTDGKVIYNPLIKSPKKSLLLVSATRIPGNDKGKNEERMKKLAKMLKETQISFLWLNFSDGVIKDAPKELINVGTFQDLQPYISKADYLVQLSDHEGFCYSILEALVSETAVICTPFETTRELGVIDGENGYIVPFDMNFDVSKLLKVPHFSYSWNNEKIFNQWDKLLKRNQKKAADDKVRIRVQRRYRDMELNKWLEPGECYYFKQNRAKYVSSLGYIRILEEGV